MHKGENGKKGKTVKGTTYLNSYGAVSYKELRVIYARHMVYEKGITNRYTRTWKGRKMCFWEDKMVLSKNQKLYM